MRISFDKSADALYIRMAADEVQISETLVLDPGTLVDIDHDGHLGGIEVLRPARNWPLEQVLKEFEISESEASVLRSIWKGRKEMYTGGVTRPRSRES